MSNSLTPNLIKVHLYIQKSYILLPLSELAGFRFSVHPFLVNTKNWKWSKMYLETVLVFKFMQQLLLIDHVHIDPVVWLSSLVSLSNLGVLSLCNSNYSTLSISLFEYWTCRGQRKLELSEKWVATHGHFMWHFAEMDKEQNAPCWQIA